MCACAVLVADSLCVLDARLLADSYAAKVHGRADFWQQAGRLLVVLAMALHARIGAATLLAVLWGCGVMNARAVLFYQPFRKQLVNRCLTASALVYCWACFCTTLLQLRGREKVWGKCVV